MCMSLIDIELHLIQEESRKHHIWKLYPVNHSIHLTEDRFFFIEDDHRQSGKKSGSISFSRAAEADQAHAGAKLSLDKEPNHQRVSTQIATKLNH